MRVPLLIFIFLNLLSSQKYDSLFIEAGNRGYYYKVWIYFDKKVDEKYISLSSKNLNRRVKNNSNFKNNWYDQKISEKYKKELKRLGFQIENESRWLNAVTVKCFKSDLSKISDLFFVEILITGAEDSFFILTPYSSSTFIIEVLVIGIILKSFDFALKYVSISLW